MKNTNFSNACREISQSLLQITEPTKNHAKTEIKRICTKYSLDKIPKNYESYQRWTENRMKNSKRF